MLTEQIFLFVNFGYDVLGKILCVICFVTCEESVYAKVAKFHDQVSASAVCSN